MGQSHKLLRSVVLRFAPVHKSCSVVLFPELFLLVGLLLSARFLQTGFLKTDHNRVNVM